MKKRLLLLSLMACAVFAFSACSETPETPGGGDGPDPGIVTPGPDEPEKIEITVDGNGGKFGEQTSLTVTADGNGKITVASAPVRDGYTFKGYNTKADGSGNAVTVGASGTVFIANGTIYAQWEENEPPAPEKIEITVDGNGGKFGEQTSLTVTADASGKITVASDPVRADYIFKGYNTKADGSGNAVTVGADGSTFAASTTVYAQWQLDRATLTQGHEMQFSVPSLVGAAAKAKADDMYLKAERASDGFVISMIGFGEFTDSEFVKLIFHTSEVNASGWKLQASDLSVLVNKTKAMSLTGITDFWTTDGGYTEFGHANERALGNAPEYARRDGYFTLKVKVLDSEIGFDGNTDVTLFAMEFDTKGAGEPNSQIYDAGNNGMLINGVGSGDPASQNSYYKIYDVVTVTVDGNGGKFGEQTSKSYKAVAGGHIEAVTEPVREGYTFIGYNTAVDGSGEEVTFGADGTVFDADGTVYALWRKNSTEKVEIDVDGNGGKFGEDATVTKQADDNGKIASFADPTRYGYVFEGYNLKADGSGAAVTFGESGTTFDENITVYATWRLDRETLISGYRMHFAVPEYCKAGADDMYLKADRLASDDGFEISMVGFGSMENNEYVKLVFHTSEVDGNGWGNIQRSDLMVLVNKEKAMYRTGLTDFWAYRNFGNDTALANAPEYANHGGFFTLKIKVLDSEIPQFDGEVGSRVRLFSMESVDGNLYDTEDAGWDHGMLIDGKPAGDPANQKSYFLIYEVKPDTSLTDGYDIRFATNSENIYAKAERGATSLTVSMRGFKEFKDGDFVRLIVHLGVAEDSNIWMIHADDVSFTIYKDAVYTQTGNVNFFDNEANAFHNGKKPVHYTPTFTQNDGYWDLTFTIEYIELGTDIYADTELRVLLVKYTGGALQSGMAKDGKDVGDVALERNWIVI